jgi:RNA polymerase sigma factor (sigma-70 family)
MAAKRYLRRRRAPVGSAVPLHESHATTGDAGNDVVERDLVCQTLRALTPKERAVLVLHEIYGLSGPEIGHALGMSASAVKMALFRARERFRMEYQDVDVVEEQRP